MSRVLFWNVESFGINKLNNPSLKRPKGIGGNTEQQASVMRRQVFASVLVASHPDIMVIVEVSSGDSYPDDRATNTGGMEGAIWILNRLRALNPGQGWRMVPLLRVGRRPGSKPETVAVLYRGITAGGGLIYFTGPNRWVGGQNGNSVDPATGAAGNAWPGGIPDLNAMLVPPGTAARAIPGAALHNGGQFENIVAARTRFRLAGAPGYFINYQIYRPPYMVTFTETDAAGNVQRNLTLFGVHSPAVAGDAGTFIVYLANTEDVVSPLGPNETRVIGGDFNLIQVLATGAPSGVYAPLNNYTPLIQSPGAPAPGLAQAFKGYFSTHIRPAGDTTQDSLFLWSSPAANSPYPGYGYIGSNFWQNFFSIDNILVWPFQGAPYNYSTTIMNAVEGTPFNLVHPTPGGAPPGAIALAHQMLNPAPAVPWPPAPNAPVVNQGVRTNLSSWDNYGHIRSTSDHFAIVAAV